MWVYSDNECVALEAPKRLRAYILLVLTAVKEQRQGKEKTTENDFDLFITVCYFICVK